MPDIERDATTEVHAADVALLHVTMTPEAAGRFLAALYHAAARIENEEHADWLTWGASRVRYAQMKEQPDDAA